MHEFVIYIRTAISSIRKRERLCVLNLIISYKVQSGSIACFITMDKLIYS